MRNIQKQKFYREESEPISKYILTAILIYVESKIDYIIIVIKFL